MPIMFSYGMVVAGLIGSLVLGSLGISNMEYDPVRRGEFDHYRYGAKVYKYPSQFGINNGRISKITIIDKESNEVILHYDRGWDVVPENIEDQEVVDKIIDNLEKAE